ncbi:MAG: hypothetical protein GKR93_18665 [Gammaproteobacteria bacterium]|nr:hypothetical protein [Gammaproteobacteria bacterium]
MKVTLKFVISALLLISVLSSGCTSIESRQSSVKTKHSLETGKFLSRTIRHDNYEREYIIYLPEQYRNDKALPLVLALHGYQGTATGLALETSAGLNNYAEKHGFILVYPQASHFLDYTTNNKPQFVSSWNDLAGNKSDGPLGPLCTAESEIYACPPECGQCNKCHWTACHDDIGFIKKLLIELKTELNFDPARSYLVGFSNGATFAQRLACELSHEFAAVVLANGRLSRGYNCVPDSVIPLLQINGAQDTVVPFDGSASSAGFYYTPAEKVSLDWAQQGQCSLKPESWQRKTAQSADLQCNIYQQCGATDMEVIDCLWVSGEHTWPGNRKGGGWCTDAIQMDDISHTPQCEIPPADKEVWGSELIWQFFSRHRK